MTKDPARSRPLSANVKRLMKASRMSPENPDVIKMARPYEARDYVYCDMQGSIFMEAAMKGRPMAEFAPLWMNSQMAGIFDVSFGAAGGMETDKFSNLLKIPLLLKSPETIVDTLYWVDMVVKDQENKAMALYQAMAGLPSREAPDLTALQLPKAITGEPHPLLTEGPSDAQADRKTEQSEQSDQSEQPGQPGQPPRTEEAETMEPEIELGIEPKRRKIPPPSEYHVPQGEPPDLSDMEYAYWLGFLYRCECLMHEESSHMVYGAFDEAFMWDYYRKYLGSDMAQKDLAETALTICKEIDSILVNRIWLGHEA